MLFHPIFDEIRFTLYSCMQKYLEYFVQGAVTFFKLSSRKLRKGNCHSRFWLLKVTIKKIDSKFLVKVVGIKFKKIFLKTFDYF